MMLFGDAKKMTEEIINGTASAANGAAVAWERLVGRAAWPRPRR